MSSVNHIINVNNIKNNDKLCYSVVLIKGEIVSDRNFVCDTNEIVNFHVENRDNSNNSSSTIINNHFMHLINLNPGKNTVKIQYCCTYVSLVLHFEPISTDYFVIPVYIICKNHDGTFQSSDSSNNSIESATDRIVLGTKLIQTLFAEKFHEIGLERKTFQIESDLNAHAPKCRVFHSDLNVTDVRRMKQEELWREFGRELVRSEFANDKCKYLAFISCTRYRGDKYNDSINTHDGIVALTEAHAALGGGGLAIFGSACLHTWPTKIEEVAMCFNNQNQIDKYKFMDDSCYRGTYGGCFATTLGALCHELCHTFDLGHTADGIMGRGFDEINKEFVFTPAQINSKVVRKLPTEKQHCIVDFTPNIKVTQSILPNNSKPKENSTKTSSSNSKFTSMKNTDCKTGVYWTKSCTILLYYHRWLNKYENNKHVLTVENNCIKSTAGFSVIELRDEHSGLVLKWWDFNSYGKKEFNVPEMISVTDSNQPLILVAEDIVGNILKYNI